MILGDRKWVLRANKPDKGTEMLRSKYFWIAMVVLIPFIVIWIMEGLAWAVGTLVAIVVLFLLILGATRKRRRYYHSDNYDDEPYGGPETHHYVHQKRICQNCHRTGRVERPQMPIQRGAPGIPRKPMMTCPDCKGTGYVWD